MHGETVKLCARLFVCLHDGRGRSHRSIVTRWAGCLASCLTFKRILFRSVTFSPYQMECMAIFRNSSHCCL